MLAGLALVPTAGVTQQRIVGKIASQRSKVIFRAEVGKEQLKVGRLKVRTFNLPTFKALAGY
jgi:hypothetical protein